MSTGSTGNYSKEQVAAEEAAAKRREGERAKNLYAGGNDSAAAKLKGNLGGGGSQIVERLIEGGGTDDDARTRFDNPGASDWAGEGGVAEYAERARQGAARNDNAQQINSDAFRNSLANMGANRGDQSVEDPTLSGRAVSTREEQLRALALSRDAAMGNAPSAAAYQTSIGMGDVQSNQVANMGGARGLAGLTGAQTQGSASAGMAAGNVASQGGLARSKEIGDAIGMYGSQAGTVRDQDLSRLGQNSQNAMFNVKANDDWRIGSGNLAASQGRLGVAQGTQDLAWMQEQQRGADKQFQYDQEMAAIEAGADADKAGAAIARDRESRENKRQLAGQVATAGLTAVGGAAGGPVGAALGGAAGNATKEWW